MPRARTLLREVYFATRGFAIHSWLPFAGPDRTERGCQDAALRRTEAERCARIRRVVALSEMWRARIGHSQLLGTERNVSS